MKKILVCDPIAQEGIDLLEEEGFEVDRNYDLSDEELVEKVPPYSVLIVRSSTKVNETILKAADNLRVIGRPGTGLDQIDVEFAEEMGIEVHNTPGANTTSVAELTMTHILASFRNIVSGTNSLRDGKWIKSDLMGEELKGKTLGIVGYGRIGRAVAERADAFEMDIIAFDVREVENTGPVEMVDMKTLLKQSDILTVHAPLLDSTYHMIGEEELKRMKESATLVDVSRGGIVDEEALYQALKGGDIRFASKDVFEDEPPQDSPLLELDNFHATPHIGAQTREAQKRAAVQVASKVITKLKVN